MKTVVALSAGFHNGSRVRPGTQFEVPDNFKASWVGPVDLPAATPAKPKAQPRTLSEMAKVQVKAPTELA